jgi:hypothetical protein
MYLGLKFKRGGKMGKKMDRMKEKLKMCTKSISGGVRGVSG